MKNQLNSMWRVLAVVAVITLQACGTTSVSKDIPEDGRPASVIFPDIKNDAWLKEGVFVNLDNLRKVAPGVSKDQLYDLLGRPHFSEGFGKVREWDYIFNFRTGKGNEFITCQYKVVYDKDSLAQSFHWAPAACASQLAEKPPVVVEKLVPAPVVVAVPRRTSLSADALFAFDKSSMADLQPGGQRELDALAKSVVDGGTLEGMDVVGYSDRLGATDYNQQLSQARARTVRDYLVSRGIPAGQVSAKGMGEQGAVVQCNQSAQAALVACLAPNRRVEIMVRMLAKS
ncbi:MAG: OmpA/MotB domain protein [Rhodoferax sp.]|jgi:OOP family OmpA-OmpF porin|nr:OmpA/MotB domain protein [Rhodoferax sp.]